LEEKIDAAKSYIESITYIIKTNIKNLKKMI